MKNVRGFITRNFTGTEVKYRAIDTTTEEICECTEIFPEKNLTNDKIIRKVELSEPKFRVLSIESVVPINKMYGITMDSFLANAVELDPETRKPLNVEE